jgi:hypothetical protein
MSACPLQAVLSDFEDACNHVNDKDARFIKFFVDDAAVIVNVSVAMVLLLMLLLV